MAWGQMLRLGRPGHWVKNVVVLLPVVFGMRSQDPHAWGQAATAFLAFCLASSAVYIVNDLHDREEDRLHPRKRLRPLASGAVGVPTAIVLAVGAALGALVLAAMLRPAMAVGVAGYLLLQVTYTAVLKRWVMIDVIVIALGFVLRTAMGAVAIRVAISPWLFVCIFTLCLFMGFCKRYNERVALGHGAVANNHRSTLIEYTPDLLTHLVTLSAGIAVVAFLMYSLSDSTVDRIGTHYLVYTLPVVVYAVFRFAMLSMRAAYVDPTDLILHDRPFQVSAAVWLALATAIVYGGRAWQAHWTGG